MSCLSSQHYILESSPMSFHMSKWLGYGNHLCGFFGFFFKLDFIWFKHFNYIIVLQLLPSLNQHWCLLSVECRLGIGGYCRLIPVLGTHPEEMVGQACGHRGMLIRDFCVNRKKNVRQLKYEIIK